MEIPFGLKENTINKITLDYPFEMKDDILVQDQSQGQSQGKGWGLGLGFYEFEVTLLSKI